MILKSAKNFQSKLIGLLTNFTIVAAFIFWWYLPVMYLLDVLLMDSLPLYIFNIFALPVAIYGFFISKILSLPILYEILCIGGTGILLFALLYETVSRRQKGIIIYLLCAIFIFVFAPYRPAVTLTADNTLLNPTQPNLFYRGLKNAQAMAEIAWCRYELYGWQDETLLYQSVCMDGQTTTWSFAPDRQHNPVPISNSQTTQLHVHPIPLSEISNFVDNPVHTTWGQYSMLDLAVRSKILQSPNGTWAAFISKHTYSAEDVLVLNLIE